MGNLCHIRLGRSGGRLLPDLGVLLLEPGGGVLTLPLPLT